MWDNPTRFNAYISCYRASSLCRGVIMSGDAARNPTGWYGYTPCCGTVINAMSCTVLALWCGNKWAMIGATPPQCYPHPRGCGCDKWAMIRQPHRGCTLDSPGLPTIGGYPGEQGVRDATPLGGCTFSLCAIECATCNHSWHRIIMIYASTGMGINGEMARGILKSTTPKGVGFCGERRQTG